MFRFYFVILTLVLGFVPFSGHSNPDSLMTIAEKMIDDSAAYQKSVQFCEEVWEEFNSDMSPLQKSRLQQIMGYAFVESTLYQKADSIYTAAIQELEGETDIPIENLVEIYNKKTYLSLLQGKIEPGLESIEKGASLAKAHGDTIHRAYVRILMQRAVYYNNKFRIRAAKEQINRAERIALQIEPRDSVLLADIWTTQVAAKGMNKDVEGSKEKLESIIAYAKRNPVLARSPHHRALSLLTSLQLNHIFDINGAFQTLEEMHLLVSAYYPSTHPLMARTLTELADAYSSIGEVGQTRRYAEQAQYVLEDLPGRVTLKLKNLEYLASSYFVEGKYTESKRYYRRAYNLGRSSEELDPLHDVSPLIQLSWCAIREEKYDRARELIDSARMIYAEAGLQHAWTISKLHEVNGNYLRAIGRHDESVSEHKLALKHTIKDFGEEHVEVGEQLLQIGEVYMMNEDLDSAQYFIDSAIRNLNVVHVFDSNEVNPVSYSFLISSHQIKGTIHFERYLKKLNRAELDQSMASFENAIRLLKLWRQYMSSQTTRQILGEMYYDVYSGAIKTALVIYRLEPNSKNLNRLYELIQSSKAQSLLENIFDTRLKNFAHVPDDLLEKENELHRKIAYLERSLKERPYFAEKWKNELFQTNLELRDLVVRFKHDYPSYYELKYDHSTVSLEEAQNSLENEQALLEYFLGGEFIYVIVITEDKEEVYDLPRSDSLEYFIRQMRDGISDYYLSELKSDDNYRRSKRMYTKSAMALYQQLIEPLSSLPDQLIIIPDGVLGYIPFEALLTERTKTRSPYSTYPYLIRDKEIYYHYSSILLFRDRRETIDNNKLLALAPQFGMKDDYPIAMVRQGRLLPLMGNAEEVMSIEKLFSGKLLMGDDANKEEFSMHASDYGIIHFATHAVVNDEHVDQSFLALASSGDTVEDAHLYIKDLYNSLIPAQLVVLSACETGLGELKKGEGIISLARGFSYAGAQAVITSLWSVSDRATADLMKTFYGGLRKGQSKTSALRNAKLNMISSDNQTFSAPFYWASTIAIGDMSPLTTDRTFIWIIISGLIFILGLYYFYIMRKKKSRL